MKRILAALLTVFMTLNIAATLPVMAAAGIPDSDYTFMDTAYSPELGMYIAIAKNADGNSWIYKSTNGVEWEKTRSSTLLGIHYANKNTRQSVVWWEKIQKFVFIMNNEIYTYDGTSYKKIGTYRANSTIAVNSDKLVTGTGRRINVWDDLVTNGANAEGFTVDHIVSQTGSIYMGAVAISDDGVATGTTSAYMWQLKPNEDDPTKPIEYSLVNESGGMPVDMVYVSGLDAFVSINGTTKVRVMPKNPETMSFTDLNNIHLSDGTTNTDKITAIGTGNGYVVLGTDAGRIFMSRSEEVTNGVWQVIEPGFGGNNTEEMRSISVVDENTFFAVSNEKIFLIKKDAEENWSYYDTDSASVIIDAPERVEIPDEMAEIFDLSAVSYNFDGTESTDRVVSFTNTTEIPEGVTSEIIGDSMIRLTINPETVGGHDITYKAVSQSGKTAETTVKIVDEDHIEIRGEDAMMLPAETDPVGKYSYQAVAVGTDGEDMVRPTVFEVLEMPEGVEYDEATQTFSIRITSSPGTIVLKAYSNHYPDKGVVKEIILSPREIGAVKILTGEDAVDIPDDGEAVYAYTAGVYDQVNKSMPKEMVEWSVVAKDISSMNGISFDSKKRLLNIGSSAVNGTIILRAAAQNKPEIFTEKEITLNYKDKRVAREDLATVRFDTSEPLTENLELPKTGPLGSKFTYRSSDETLLLPDGTIKRPSREDKTVSITVLSQKGTGAAEATYTFTVKKADDLCTNGNFANGTTDGWSPIGETTLTMTSEDGTNIMQADGEGAYQTLTLTNDSSYGFTAWVKAEKGKTISLVSDKGNTLATVTATGAWQEIKGNYDYRKQKASFEDNIYLKCNGVLSVDYLRAFEITVEYQELMDAVNKAVYSKKKADVDAAKALLEDFYDLPAKDDMKDKLNAIKIETNRPGGGGSTGGGGGTRPSNTGGTKNPTNISNPTGKTDDFEDQLDTYLLTFKDMKTHWAREDVEALAKLELLNGDENGAFRPDDKISRAEFAAMLAKVMGLDAEEYSNTFFDVVSDDWFSGYVQSVRSNNIMNGYDGLFNPKSMITREEIAKSVVSAYNMKANKELERGKSLYFNDLEDVSSWAYDYIAEAAELGFVNGVTEELFKPKETATRAQAAVMLKRVYDELNSTEN